MFRFNLLHPCQIMGQVVAFNEHRGEGVFQPVEVTVKSLLFTDILGTQFVTINPDGPHGYTVPACTAVEVIRVDKGR